MHILEWKDITRRIDRQVLTRVRPVRVTKRQKIRKKKDKERNLRSYCSKLATFPEHSRRRIEIKFYMVVSLRGVVLISNFIEIG